MIALDTNILVYAHREESPFHEAAFRRVAALAEGPALWAIPWPCLYEFLAIVTHAHAPLTHALDQVDAWLEIANFATIGRGVGTMAGLARDDRRWPRNWGASA